jgi:SAM-dependent methyltransferase
MGFRRWYEETIVSRLIKCACNDPKIQELRAQVVPLAAGRVFELGCGGGLNQPFYDADKVTGFAAIDPGHALLDAARAAARARGWEADIREGVGEDIPFADESFDSVVCTYTMCSVSDQARVLGELRRVLKPGGRLFFLEHGKAPDPGPARWQRRIEPVWKNLMGNCHLTREASGAVAAQGFAIERLDSKYVEAMPRWAGFTEWGVAVKQGA